MAHTFEARVGLDKFPIIIGQNIFQELKAFIKTYDRNNIFIICDSYFKNLEDSKIKELKFIEEYNLIFDESAKIYSIKGSSFSGKAPSNAVIGNWWNHNILQSEVIISPISGSLKFQEVIFLSKEILKIDGNIYNTSLFKIVLRKSIGDEKKEEFNVWLDDKSKIILKVSYSKFGDWEYIVKKIEKLD